MQNDVTTDSADDILGLSEEDWQIALEPYEGHPLDALSLGFRLAVMKQQILDLKMPDALAELDQAIECLFEHSDFRRAGRELFQIAVEGRLTIEQEELLRQLGVRI